MKKLFTMGVLLLITACAFSQPIGSSIPPLDGERSRIQAERARAEAHSAKEEAPCYARFAVNDCLRDVRARLREVLAALRRQELALNVIERERKALQQRAQIDERSSTQRKEDEAAKRLEARAAQQERELRASQKAAATANKKSGQGAADSVPTNVVRGRTTDELAQEQTRYQNKLRQAQEHRASREKSNKDKKPGASSKPLPERP